MVAWFIIAISTIGMLAFVAANGIGMISSASDASQRVETVRRLDLAKAALEARMATDGTSALPLLPVGTQGGSSDGYLPPSLPVSTTTPFGKKFIYCPFGPVAGGSGTTITSVTGNYTVSVSNGYVSAGRPAYARVSADPELMGYLMALRGKTGTQPSCSDVTYNATTGGYEAPNAIVRPLSRTSGIDQLRQQNTREIVFYVSTTGTTAATGATAADPTTLARAVAFIKAKQPEAATIIFLAGTYVTDDPNIFQFASGGLTTTRGSGRITLDAVTAGTVQINNTQRVIVQSYGDMLVRGLTFDSNSTFIGSQGNKLTITNSTTGLIVLTNATANLSNLTLLPTANSASLWIFGSKVESDGPIAIGVTTNSYGMYVGPGGSFNTLSNVTFFNAGTGGVTTGWLVYVGQGGTWSGSGGTYQFNVPATNPIYVDGGILNWSSVNLTASVQHDWIINGANNPTLNLASSNIAVTGTAPLNTMIMGAAGATLRGSSTTLGVSNAGGAYCWSGALTAWTGAPAWRTQNGVMQVSTTDVAVPAMPAVYTAAGAQAYADAINANALAAAARARNSASWTCTMR